MNIQFLKSGNFGNKFLDKKRLFSILKIYFESVTRLLLLVVRFKCPKKVADAGGNSGHNDFVL